MMGRTRPPAGPASAGGPAQAVLPLAGAAGVKLAARPGMAAGSYKGHIDAVQDPMELAALLVDDAVHAVGVEGQAQLWA